MSHEYTLTLLRYHSTGDDRRNNYRYYNCREKAKEEDVVTIAREINTESSALNKSS